MPNDPEPITASDATTKSFIATFRGTMIAVAIGIAPFLGTIQIPAFKPLAVLLPFQIRADTIPISIFLMGVIAAAVEFYGAEDLSPQRIKQRFGYVLIALVVGLLFFVVVRDLFTETVTVKAGTFNVLIGPKRLEACSCSTCACPPEITSDGDCISRLVLTRAAIETCWGSLKGRALLLKTSYWLLTGGFGGLIGLIELQRSARRQRREAEKKLQEAQAAAPPPTATQGSSSGSPPVGPSAG